MNSKDQNIDRVHDLAQKLYGTPENKRDHRRTASKRQKHEGQRIATNKNTA